MSTQEDTMGTPLMMGIQELARQLQCSKRHITNLRNSRRIPPPVMLGNIVRWPRRVIEAWVNSGCPPAHDIVRAESQQD